MKNSWRTSTLGWVCIVFGLLVIRENIAEHLYNFHRLMESLHYWASPLALEAVGIGLLHAADHKNLPPPTK